LKRSAANWKSSQIAAIGEAQLDTPAGPRQ